MGEEQKKRGGIGTLIVRIVLIVILIAVIIFGLKWRGVVAEYKRGLALYEQEQFEEAAEVFEAVQDRPLARLKVRKQARLNLGRCKAEMATSMAFKEKTVEAYTKAIQLLEEAKELSGPSEEYDRRIKEYQGYIDSEKKPETEAPEAKPTPAAGGDAGNKAPEGAQ